MKKLLIYPMLFVCFVVYGQNPAKTDTIFSLKYNYDRIENSKMSQLTNDLISKCKTKHLDFDRTLSLEYNQEYSILSTLKEFEKFTKSTIFSDYKYFIYSYFCFDCDFLDEITLIEFHYTQKSKAEIFKRKIEQIINDKEFYNYPQEKLFYYKILNNNVCYLLISIKNNANNEIFSEIKTRIEKLE
jgi:hypothetical protein